MRDLYKKKEDDGPGVPEAIPRSLQRVAAELGLETLDRVWIFPPMISGRSESGLLAVSRFHGGEDLARRILSVFPYVAERTGKGLTLEGALEEHGEAPLDRLPRVMEGVVARTEKDLGDPTEVELEGDEDRFLELMATFDPALLDPELPPAAEPGEPEVADTGEQAAAGSSGTSAAFLDENNSEGRPEEPKDEVDELLDLYTPGSAR